MATVQIPAPPKGLLSNVLGLVGLATIAVMVAFLTDWRWGGLTAGVFLVGLAVLAQWSTPVAGVHPIERRKAS